MKNYLSFVQSLYGGFWNFEIKDFNYLVNPYFPPDRFINAIKSNLDILIRSYPSTNWYISKLCADFVGLNEDQLVIANGASELISAATQRFVKRTSTVKVKKTSVVLDWWINLPPSKLTPPLPT